MKMFVIKKGAEVFGLNENCELVVTDTLARDVTFSENWFIKTFKCSACDCGIEYTLFGHKYFSFLQVESKYVEVEEAA